MFNIIKTVIESKDYVLEDILYKIDKMYIQDRISEAENSYNIQKQLDNIFTRLEALENKDKTEGPTEQEEYPPFKQPTGSHDTYNTGDKITDNGKKYICKMDNCVWGPAVYPAAWEEVIETEENVESEG